MTNRGVRLVRFGGLSAINHGRLRKEKPDSEHCPPRRKGIYAFPWPHMDLFFVCWHDQGNRELMHNGVRDFYYDGPIWTHICGNRCDPCLYHDRKCKKVEWVGAWHEVSAQEFAEIYRRDCHDLNKSLVKSGLKEFRKDWDGRLPSNPYIRGRSGFGITFAVDNLEVFIEKKYLGRIR